MPTKIDFPLPKEREREARRGGVVLSHSSPFLFSRSKKSWKYIRAEEERRSGTFLSMYNIHIISTREVFDIHSSSNQTRENLELC